MKRIQRIISTCLTLCLLFSLLPVQAFAEESDTQYSEEIIYSVSEHTDSDELYEGYVLQQFCGGTSFFGVAGGEQLVGDEKLLYDALVPIIRQIADGERASATIVIGQGSAVDSEAVFTGTEITRDMLSRLLDALLADLPYECYWYDKTTGCGMSYSYGDTVTKVTLRFTVGQKYRGADQYTADTAKTGAAKLAAANAKSIVSKYAGASDYEMLLGYRDEICALVSYDGNAASTDNYYKTDLDPWQLISVFDGDNTTNVVCEGYSKAFMYLCDMTDFTGDVSCHTVSGTMNGGGHMWNIVDIAGKHYLADITNSDVGTSGDDGSLFLAGGTGTAAGGYTVSGIRYAYKTDMTELWGTGEDSLLTLEAENYVPDGGSDTIISGTHGSNVTWMFNENTGTLTIAGKGTIKQESSGMVMPWYSLCDQIIAVVVEEGITVIPSYVFEYLEKAESILLPETLTTLALNAFNNCGSLNNLVIPDSVTTLTGSSNAGHPNFIRCESLTDVYYMGTEAEWLTIPEAEYVQNADAEMTMHFLVLHEDPATCTESGTQSYYTFDDTSVYSDKYDLNKNVVTTLEEIPALGHKWDAGTVTKEPTETETGIRTYTCTVCAGTKTEKIAVLVHTHSYDTETVTLPTCIAQGFTTHTCACGDSYVDSYTDATGVHSYVDSVCEHCGAIGGTCGENLTWTFDLESGLLTILGTGEMDQYYDKNQPWEEYNNDIIKVTVDEGVTSLSTYALFECEAMTQLNLPASLADIYENSLPIVGALTAINVAADNSSYCTDNGVLYSKGMQALMKYPAHKMDASYTVPNSVTVIAFNAFAGCMNLNKLFFEGNAPFIDETSFEMTAFTICYPANDPTWTSDVMLDYGGNITWEPDCGGNHSLVIVPAVEATCQATGLTDGVSCEVCGFVSRAQEVVPVSDHKYDAFNVCRFCGILGGNCGLEITNLKWTLSEEGVLTISGTGDMRNVDSSIYSPWNSHSDKITSVVVEEGVETIGSNMLGLLPNLKQVSLPETLRHIGTGAFHTNPQLEYIDFPKSLESIGSSAFQNSGLKEVALPENVWIGAYAFENCTALKKVKIDSALDTDSNGSYLFQGCTALTDVTLGENVKRIGQYMFAGCTSLKQITIPGNVKMLAGNAFDGCTALTDVTLVNGVEHIGPKAFARCSALREFTFPGSITEMEEGVFNRCENLDQIWFVGDAPVIDGSAFSTLKVQAYYPADNNTWTKDVRRYYGSTLIEWVPYNHTHSYTPVVTAPNCTEQGYTTHTCSCGDTYRDSYVAPTGEHTYSDDRDMSCNVCGYDRSKPVVPSVPMHRMYDPNSGEHFYSGSELERDFLVEAGWHYEGVGFNFPEEGAPVHRLYDPQHGEHLYTMDEAEMNKLLSKGWNYEGVAFNSAGTDEVPQYRLHNPNAKRGGYHFTGSELERDILIAAGWEYQGIGWYSCLE